MHLLNRHVPGSFLMTIFRILSADIHVAQAQHKYSSNSEIV